MNVHNNNAVTAPTKMWAWQNVLRLLARGVVVGCGLACLVLVLDIMTHLSLAREYQEVRPGMVYWQAASVLRAGEISCQLTEDQNTATQCTFSDFWRKYLIEVDSAQGIVVHKRFEFRHRRDIFTHLARLIRHLAG